MSYYKAKHGDKIRKYWHQGSENELVLRNWMRANGLRDDISITEFCRLEQHEEKRVAFLRSVKKVNKKSK
jgi:hypothetical protein